MTDASFQAQALITGGEAKLRQSRIRDQMRKAGLRAPLKCDSLYERGVLVTPHWLSLHEFRSDLMEIPDKVRLQDDRWYLASDAKARKINGFSMQSVPIQRAKRCPKVMDGAVYRAALILVGEVHGDISDEEARVAGWQVCEVYTGQASTQRWREWG